MDEENQTEETEQTISNATSTISNGTKKVVNGAKKISKALSKVARAIHTVISAIVSFVAAFWWLILIIFGVVLIDTLIITIFGMGITAGINGVYENGKYTPSAGAMGDKFYGERYVYYDDTFSNEEISDYYTQLSWGLMNGAIQQGTIAITNFPADYLQSEDAVKIALSFTKSISSLTNDNMTITYYAGGIDHYGLTETESNSFLNMTADYIIAKGYNSTGKTRENVFNAITNTFNNDYSYMKNVCKRIIIKDFIFNAEDTGMINIEAKNYCGMVFMPKEDLTITNTEFAFIIPQGNNVTASYYEYSDGVSSQISTAEADSSWFKDGIIEELFKVDMSNNPLKKFEAIDTENINYLSDGVSLFTMLKDNKFNVYFNDIIVNIDTNTNDLLTNVKTDNYQYIECECNSDGYYIFTDALTE